LDNAGELTDLPLFAEASVPSPTEQAISGATARVLGLQDLVRLVARPQTRSRSAVSTDQLGFFGA
jgi:hypothetical protein